MCRDPAFQMPREPSLSEMFRAFGRIGLLSFGGPAAQIALMHAELVERRAWLDERQFLGALSFCMLLPGPEAMQLATYAGWRLRGAIGGLLAGLLFVLPGAVVILALALGYVWAGDLPLVQSVFTGIKAAVVAVVLHALLSLSRRALAGPVHRTMAALAFAAIFFLALPFPAIIAAAAFCGYLLGPAEAAPSTERPPAPPGRETARRTLATVLVWCTLWLAPLGALWLAGAEFLTGIGLFFSKLAIVTFGGAYAVLAYMTQTVIEDYGWLSTAQMIDALGLAETTPGPLILVTEFVALLAGHQQGGLGAALAAGAVALWVTFLPCFLWIFAGAPYVETLLARPRLTSALRGISAAVVGVILNLSLWFTLHVIFATVSRGRFGPLPDADSFLPVNLALVTLACGLHLGLRVPIPALLGLMGALAAAIDLFA